MRKLSFFPIIFLCVTLHAGTLAQAEQASILNSDHHLHGHFGEFAQNRVSILNKHYDGTPEKLRLEKNENGYTGRYQQIVPGSLRVEVKQTGSNTSPFIGVMYYTVMTYESNGKCSESVSSGPFQPVRKRNVTEIFRLVRGEWK